MLSQGAIQKIMANDTSISPRLQIIDVRTINNKDGLKKTRVILSDGLNFMYGALAPACNYLFVEGQMTKFCLINLKEFSTANCLINVIKCEVINQMKSKIGDPVMAKKKVQSCFLCFNFLITNYFVNSLNLVLVLLRYRLIKKHFMNRKAD